MFHASGISNNQVCTPKSRLHFHNFTVWVLMAFQGLPCDTYMASVVPRNAEKNKMSGWFFTLHVSQANTVCTTLTNSTATLRGANTLVNHIFSRFVCSYFQEAENSSDDFLPEFESPSIWCLFLRIPTPFFQFGAGSLSLKTILAAGLSSVILSLQCHSMTLSI